MSTATAATAVRRGVGVVCWPLSQLWWKRFFPHLHLDELFDFGEVPHLTGGDQRDAHTSTSGPRGSTNAVHIVFFVWWNIVVDDHFDVVDVDASAYDVRGDQYVHFTVAEPAHDIFSVLLFQIGTDGSYV
jgi:hypothetical protein